MVTSFAVPELLRSSTAEQQLTFVNAYAKLHRRGFRIAPAVLHALIAGSHGELKALEQLAERLDDDQRAGVRVLPDPLPLVPAVAADFAGLSLSGTESATLLAAAVCIDDRVDVLLEFSALSMSDLIDSRLSDLLLLAAGRFTFADERVRSWVHESATLTERTATHAELAEIYRRQGDVRRMTWHRALSTMEGDASLVPPLLAAAEAALAEGEAAQAYAFAREAASHADVQTLDAARTLAGRAAVGGGWLADALDWLVPVVAAGSASAHPGTLVAYVVAASLRHGAVSRADIAQNSYSYMRSGAICEITLAACVAAVLAAERGVKADSRAWLMMARQAGATTERDLAMREASAAWSGFLLGESSELDSAGNAGPFASAYRAVELGASGDITGGLALLADENRRCWAPGARGAYFAQAPLSLAYRAVAEALLLVWQGSLGRAADVLREAAATAPLSLPFAGAGAVLAGQLEIAISGRYGPLSTSLRSARCTVPGQERLADRAMESYLRGQVDEAAAHIGVWRDLGAPAPAVSAICLDEVGPLEPIALLAPPDATLARSLRLRLRSGQANTWRKDYQVVIDESRLIASPFERGRVEALLGTMCMTRGENGAGLQHLRTARSLFLSAGAAAWTSTVERRIERLGASLAETAKLSTVPIPQIASEVPLARCRAVWAPLMTDRELSVAMAVAEGRTNREIAEQFLLSVRTVEVHVGRLFIKLDVRSRGELMALAHRTDQHG